LFIKKKGVRPWGIGISILSESSKPMRDRVCDYLPVGFPVGVDLFPYTKKEFDALLERSPGWYKTIAMGIEITSQRKGES
jgi:hypothetical protein